MKKIELKNKDLEKTLNKYFKDYKTEVMFYNQSLSSDYVKTIYDDKNNVIAKFYSDNLFDDCKLYIY